MTNIEILEFNNKVHQKECKTTTQMFVDNDKGIIVIITEWTECHCNIGEKDE